MILFPAHFSQPLKHNTFTKDFNKFESIPSDIGLFTALDTIEFGESFMLFSQDRDILLNLCTVPSNVMQP